jgi:site-specific DNA recombinase
LRQIADFSDPTLKTERDQAKAALDRAFAELRPETRITDEKIAAFASLMRENVKNGPVSARGHRPGRSR